MAIQTNDAVSPERPTAGRTKGGVGWLCERLVSQDKWGERTLGFRRILAEAERPLWGAQRQQADVRSLGLRTAAVD
jgi:hypothetical protein